MRTAAIVAAALGVVGCVEHNPGVEGTQSLRVTLVAPSDPGSADARLPAGQDPGADAARMITVSVEALDENAERDATVTRAVSVHAQFLGNLTPSLGQAPLATVPLTAGVSGNATVSLPPVFGPTFLWVEDSQGDEATYATGTSPVLWYRDPYVEDVQRPPDETALDALSTSPLQDKQVIVSASKHQPDGRFVVTSIYAQGYTVSDVQCGAGGAPPCTPHDYGHVLVFSFSRPRDENGCDLEIGQVIDGFSGAVQEFNGLTELGFPQTFVASTTRMDEADNQHCDRVDVDPGRIPPPAPLDATGADSWFTELIQFERNEGGLIAIDDGTMCGGMPCLPAGFPVLCPLDNDYVTYKQWKLDVGLGCDSPVNVITSGVITTFDPALYVGQQIPRVVGSLRPVNIGTFNVWILYPRSAADLTLP